MSDPTLAQEFGCSPAITCPGSDNPIMNISSEAPDEPIFIGLNWGPVIPPPVLNHYSAIGCLGECDSTIGQQDADLCAARQSLQCVNTQPNLPPGTPPRFTIICNTPQTATVHCPDGLPFSYTVPAGLFCGSSQTLVNQQALAYATQLANEVRICMGSPQRCACINQAYSSNINLGGAGSSSAVWSIIFGVLPPGLNMSQTGLISGIPNAAGTYTFEVMALTSIGTFMQKTFQITVLQITTTNIPGFQTGVPYSYQMAVVGGSGNYGWKVATGSLPDGLTISQGGLISGTPTGNTPGSGTITFGVVDLSCETFEQAAAPPKATLSATSLTTVGELLGFSEYHPFESNPPKKYRRLTWQGHSEQTLFNGALQIAGARYDWNGDTEIDLDGNFLSTYTKELTEMCNAADKLCMGMASTRPPVPLFMEAAYNILGFIGQAPTAQCPGTGLPYTSFGDVAIGNGDLAKYDAGFGSGVLFGADGTFSGFNGTFQANGAVNASDSNTGSQSIQIILNPVACGTVLDVFPFNQPPLMVTVLLKWDNDYTAELDEEYTEQDALDQGDSVHGAGVTAAYVRNGFNVLSTTVNWTIALTNLIAGQKYNVTYQLWNSVLGTTQLVSTTVTASGTTAQINGTIPAPPSGQAVTIRNPTITFAT